MTSLNLDMDSLFSQQPALKKTPEQSPEKECITMGLPNRISLRGSGDCVEMFRGVRAGIPYWTKLSPEASREILDIKTTYIMNHPRAKIRKYKSGGEAMNISTKSWKVFAKIFDTKNRTVQIAWIYNSKTIEEIKKWSPA